MFPIFSKDILYMSHSWHIGANIKYSCCHVDLVWRTKTFLQLVYLLASTAGLVSLQIWKVQSAAECGWETLSMRSTSHLRSLLKGIKAAWKVLIWSPAIEKKLQNSQLQLDCRCKSSLLPDGGGGLSRSFFFIPYMRPDLGEWPAVLMLYFVPKLRACLVFRLSWTPSI